MSGVCGGRPPLPPPLCPRQLVTRRYEVVSTVLTSNEGFEEWGEILGDEVMAVALIDRLLHHCHIVNIRGNAYRMRKQCAPTVSGWR